MRGVNGAAGSPIAPAPALSTNPLDDLGPALRVLTGGDTHAIAAFHSGEPASGRLLERYAVAPSAANPRVLLPLDATSQAFSAALALYAGGASNPLARGAARVLSFAGQLGLAAIPLRHRVCIAALAEGPGETPLHAFLAEVLGRSDFVTTMRIAPRRPNGKPVVQALAPDGSALAYAKFGWDDLTRSLIRHETTTLCELAILTQRKPIRVPHVLYGGAWRGFEVLVVAPLSGKRPPQGSRSKTPVAAAKTLASLRPTARERLGETAYWRRIADQVADAVSPLSGEAREVVVAATRLVNERWGDLQMPTGQGHGDWIPPNMSLGEDGVVNVWDWERSSRDMPHGLDLIQYVTYQEVRRPAPCWAVARRLRRHGEAALAAQGLDPRACTLLLTLNLLRTLAWRGEARLAGRRSMQDSRCTILLKALLDMRTG